VARDTSARVAAERQRASAMEMARREMLLHKRYHHAGGTQHIVPNRRSGDKEKKRGRPARSFRRTRSHSSLPAFGDVHVVQEEGYVSPASDVFMWPLLSILLSGRNSQITAVRYFGKYGAHVLHDHKCTT